MGMRLKLCLVGGTFDRFHVGHAHLLANTLAVTELAEVWITSDEMARVKSSQIEPFETRREAILSWADSHADGRIKTFELNDSFGPAPIRPDCDGIICTPETLSNWQEIPQVEGWSFESFVVKHVPEVEPHGWMMRHEDGLVMLHSGDSGPCDELWRRVGECDLAIVEMGLPEFVESDEHHKPSSIETLATNNPDTKIVVTHTYVDDGPEIVSAKIPEHPTNVIHARDGAAFFWNGEDITVL